ADVVQQQREINERGAIEFLKQLRVTGMRRSGGAPDAIKLLETHQRVLVRGVLMIKLVLNEAGELAELGNVFAEKIHLVHGAKDDGHVAALAENGQERFAHVFIGEKLAIHEAQFGTDQLREIGMEPQAALLGVEKH